MSGGPKKSLSGIKSTGIPHLGNYFGMILPAIRLQETHDASYFIANLHALTTVRNPVALKADTLKVAAYFLALGFDTSRGALYRQSDIPEVTELCWMLSTVVSMGDLFRAHTFKAAKDKGEEGELNLGVFSYPVLMAADILINDADVVPVGKDQLQHLEMARAIAKRFNFHFGETFKEPKELIQESVATVPGIDGRKMSKSYGNVIEPLEPAKEVKKQVMAIVTDSKGLEDKKDPSTCNIVALYKLFANPEEIKTMEENYRRGGYGYGHAKIALLEKIENVFAEPRKQYEELLQNPTQIEEALKKGAARARVATHRVMERARKACGLTP